ncbi:hypothetical protein AAY473_031563, partial [Plecturocebus cupreus]
MFSRRPGASRPGFRITVTWGTSPNHRCPDPPLTVLLWKSRFREEVILPSLRLWLSTPTSVGITSTVLRPAPDLPGQCGEGQERLLLFKPLQALSHSVTQARVQWRDLSSLSPLPPGLKQDFTMLARLVSNSWPQVICPLRPPEILKVLEIQFLAKETGFHYVGQAGLELLTLGDLPVSASQNSGIIDVSHCTHHTSFIPSSDFLLLINIIFFQIEELPLAFPDLTLLPRLRQGLTVLHRLVFNSWVQAVIPPRLPKILRLQTLIVGQKCAKHTLECSDAIWAHHNLRLLGSSNSPASASGVAGIIDGCLHVGQAGLKLPTSGDLSPLASQSAGITGVSHRAWPDTYLYLAFMSGLGYGTRISLALLPDSRLECSDGVLLCRPGCSAVARSWPTAVSTSWVHMILLPQDSQNLTLSARLEWSGAILAHCNLHLLDSSHCCASDCEAVGITGMCPYSRLIFIFLIEMGFTMLPAVLELQTSETGFHHVGQVGPKLLASYGPPALAFQSAVITDMSHCTWP